MKLIRVLFILFFTSSSAFAQSSTPIPGAVKCKSLTGRVLHGEASYYGNSWVGKTMACGGSFSQDRPTAAIQVDYMRSKKIPCGTVLIVTRTDKKSKSGQPLSVEVTVRDNGPLRPGRIIDLPTSVARKLGFGPGGEGLAHVKAEVCRR